MAVTAPVDILKLPDTAPDATVTEAGAVNTADAELVSATTAPPADAARDSVTVQAVLPFEERSVTEHATPRTVCKGCSETVAVALVPFQAAVRVAVEGTVSVAVEMLNRPVVAPADMVTDAGADNSADALFVNATTAPPAGEAEDKVTVQLVLVLDDNTAALQLNPVTDIGGCSDIVAVAVEPFSDPVKVAVWFAVTVPVEILNVALTAPAATVTDAGADKAGDALLLNVTAAPPVGAAFEIVTVQFVLLFDDRAVAVHEIPRMVARVCSGTVAVAVVPFSVAVRVAV